MFAFWQLRFATFGRPGALTSVVTIKGSELLPSFLRVYAFIQILYVEYGSGRKKDFIKILKIFARSSWLRKSEDLDQLKHLIFELTKLHGMSGITITFSAPMI